jgi:D-amino peptidase
VAEKRLPGVRTVAVKHAFGRGVARSLHPSAARQAIREASREAVAATGELRSFQPEGPYALEADVANTGVADLCSLAPGVTRPGPRTVRFETADFREGFRCLLAWTYLGIHEAPRYAGT